MLGYDVKYLHPQTLDFQNKYPTRRRVLRVGPMEEEETSARRLLAPLRQAAPGRPHAESRCRPQCGKSMSPFLVNLKSKLRPGPWNSPRVVVANHASLLFLGTQRLQFDCWAFKQPEVLRPGPNHRLPGCLPLRAHVFHKPKRSHRSRREGIEFFGAN